MPPKPSRARGGRGRGRGGSSRGGSAAVSASGTTSTAAAPEELAQTSQPVIADSASAEPIPAACPPAQTLPPESSTPQPSTTQTTPSAKPAGLAKYKPKAIRRSEADRARLKEQQDRAIAEQNAKEARLEAKPTRGRGRGRARGGLMRGSGRGSLSGGMSFGSLSGGGYGTSTGAYARASGDVDSDDRIDADALYSSVTHQVEEAKSTSTFVQTGKKRSVMPMGIRRIEHKEEPVTMITTAQIEALKLGKTPSVVDSDSDDMFVDNAKTSRGEPAAGTADDGVWAHAVPKSRSQVRIKEEPVDQDRMDLELPEGQIKGPESPQVSKKDVAGSDEKNKDKKPQFKDLEEELAAGRRQRMLELFTVREGEQASELEGHMFLFQFPRVLAPLQATAPDGTPDLVKPDPDDDEELFVSDDPPATTASIDLTTVDDSKVKKEGDGGEDDDGENQEPAKILPEAGFLGNLIVRRSGQAEISWGGRRMIVDLGIPTHYFSQAVLVEEADVKPGQFSNNYGTAHGMGRIQGKFDTAYVWDDEEEWNPAEEDLKS